MSIKIDWEHTDEDWTAINPDDELRDDILSRSGNLPRFPKWAQGAAGAVFVAGAVGLGYYSTREKVETPSPVVDQIKGIPTPNPTEEPFDGLLAEDYPWSVTQNSNGLISVEDNEQGIRLSFKFPDSVEFDPVKLGNDVEFVVKTLQDIFPTYGFIFSNIDISFEYGISDSKIVYGKPRKIPGTDRVVLPIIVPISNKNPQQRDVIYGVARSFLDVLYNDLDPNSVAAIKYLSDRSKAIEYALSGKSVEEFEKAIGISNPLQLQQYNELRYVAISESSDDRTKLVPVNEVYEGYIANGPYELFSSDISKIIGSVDLNSALAFKSAVPSGELVVLGNISKNDAKALSNVHDKVSKSLIEQGYSLHDFSNMMAFSKVDFAVVLTDKGILLISRIFSESYGNGAQVYGSYRPFLFYSAVEISGGDGKGWMFKDPLFEVEYSKFLGRYFGVPEHKLTAVNLQ